ncbi:hypothetical protein TMU01_09050 [Tenuibacillus multivorans]|nr:hypothetical protein TMU01_09050 [Tenuibacillus multivorans]
MYIPFNREGIVKRLVSSINQINRWVDVVFPELRKVFKDIKGKGAIATLRLFPTPVELFNKIKILLKKILYCLLLPINKPFYESCN